MIAFQGSESSTSDGIIKVFDKAKKYTESNKDVIPVVLLDEVGLAEISRYSLKLMQNWDIWLRLCQVKSIKGVTRPH